MGRDVDFCHNEVNYALSNVDYSLERESFVGYDIKSHRTGYHHSSEGYEDYGVLIWMDENGKKKKKGKKRITFEEQSYQPDDYVKKWKVQIRPGDFYVTALCYHDGTVVVDVRELEKVEYEGSQVIHLKDSEDNLIWEGIDRKYKICGKEIGVLRMEMASREEIVEEIHKCFDEKFWNVLEKIVKSAQIQF